MQIKKGGRFFIFSTIFFVSLIPKVFALYEYYTYSYSFDIVELYLRFQGIIDPVILTIVFGLLFTLLLPRVFGKDQNEETKHTIEKLAIILGIVAGLGVTYLGRSIAGGQGIILGLGPFWAFLGFLLFLLWIYNLFKGDQEGKLSWGVALLILLLTFLLASLVLPGIFEPIARWIFGNPILLLIVAILGIIGVISLILWIISLLKGKLGRAAPADREERGVPPERPSEPPTNSTTKPPKTPNIKVRLLFHPQGPFRPGEKVTFITEITEKSGWFGSKQLRSDNFVCEWKIGNQVLSETKTPFTWEIPQSMINQADQKIKIEITIQDTQDPRRVASDSTIIHIRGGIPKLIITKPVNTDSSTPQSIEVNEDALVDYEYRLDTREAAPEGVAGVNWLAAEGHITKIDKGTIKKSQLLNKKDKFQLAADYLPSGIWTIICIAVDSKGKPYKLPIIDKYLEAHFTLNIKSRGKTPQPPQKELLKIIEPATKENSKKNPVAISFDTPIKLKADADPRIDKIEWNLQADHKEQASTDTIKNLGEGKDATYLGFKNQLPDLMPEGEYTIFAYGYVGNKLAAIDYIWINILSKSAQQNNFSVKVSDYTTNNPRGISTENKPLTINAAVKDSLFLEAIATNLKNYDLTWEGKSTLGKSDTTAISPDNTKVIIEFNEPGNNKEIRCMFTKKGETTPTATVKVTFQVGTETKPEIKIIKVNNKSVKTGEKVDLLLDTEAIFEVLINDPKNQITEIFWYYRKGGSMNGFNRSKGNIMKFTFLNSEFVEEEYPLFAVAGSNGHVLSLNGTNLEDHITLKFTKAKPAEPDIKIIKINNQNANAGRIIEIPLNGELILEGEINNPELIDGFYWKVLDTKTHTTEALGLNKSEKFVYPYFTNEYFKENTVYEIQLTGKKSNKEIKDSKGTLVFNAATIKTLPATRTVQKPKWKKKKN